MQVDESVLNTSDSRQFLPLFLHALFTGRHAAKHGKGHPSPCNHATCPPSDAARIKVKGPNQRWARLNDLHGTEKLLEVGLEPTISSLGGRHLIH